MLFVAISQKCKTLKTTQENQITVENMKENPKEKSPLHFVCFHLQCVPSGNLRVFVLGNEPKETVPWKQTGRQPGALLCVCESTYINFYHSHLASLVAKQMKEKKFSVAHFTAMLFARSLCEVSA